MPLPNELATPPVTKMYFVSMLCEIELFKFMRKYNNAKELQNKTRGKPITISSILKFFVKEKVRRESLRS